MVGRGDRVVHIEWTATAESPAGRAPETLNVVKTASGYMIIAKLIGAPPGAYWNLNRSSCVEASFSLMVSLRQPVQLAPVCQL